MVAIFVIATILTCIGIEIALDRVARRKHATVPARAVQAADRFLIPRGYFLSRGHSWVELLVNGNARIGLDDFVQKLVGTVDTIVTPTPNAQVKKGEKLFTIRQGERTLTFLSPLSGRIVEVNPTLPLEPGVLKQDPYVSGWVAVIEPTNLAQELKPLAVAEDALQWLREEIRRFRNFVKEQVSLPVPGALAPANVTLLDGGMPLAGVLQQTDGKTWQAFEREFLATNGITTN
ncbi:MAG: hypothetical protein WBD36_16825 [Bacteroidota bacterium]